MFSRIVIFIGLVVTGLPQAGEARDIFVDNQRGDDRRDGATTANPCQTIRRALELAQKGDRVILEKTNQPYRESVTLQSGKHSGEANQPFRLIGNGAILNGLAEVPPTSWAHFKGDTFRFRPARIRHQLLYLNGKPADRVKVDGASPPELEPLQ